MKKIIFLFIISVILVGCESKKSDSTKVEPMPEARIGVYNGEASFLIHLAKEQKLFDKYGIDVIIKDYMSGKDAFDAMLKGDVDFADCTEYVVVKNSFTNREFKIIASIAEADINGVLIKKSSGIQHPSDFKGKNLGTTFGSLTEYLTGVFLEQYGLNIHDVNLIDVDVKDRRNFVANNSLDALFAWDPDLFHLRESNPEVLTYFSLPPGFQFHFVLVESDAYNEKEPTVSVRILKALLDAEHWVHTHPELLLSKVSEKYNNTKEYTQYALTKHHYNVTFPFTLLSAMEGQLSWLMNSKIKKSSKTESLLTLFNIEPLRNIKPQVITVIE